MKKCLNKLKIYAMSFVIAVPLTFVENSFEVIEKYIFADWEYLKFLIVFMTIDTIISWWYHLRNKTFSSKGFAQLFTKLIIYSILLIIAHGFATNTIGGETIEPMKWFRTFICTALLVREGISIVENLNKIQPGLIPPMITKHLKDFDEKGKFRGND